MLLRLFLSFLRLLSVIVRKPTQEKIQGDALSETMKKCSYFVISFSPLFSSFWHRKKIRANEITYRKDAKQVVWASRNFLSFSFFFEIRLKSSSPKLR